MSVYLIATIRIRDRATYGAYESGFMEIFSRFNGHVLAVDEAPVVVEGSWPWTRTVLITFPSKDDAMSWYRSDDYQQLARHRFAASEADIVLVQGLDG